MKFIVNVDRQKTRKRGRERDNDREMLNAAA